MHTECIRLEPSVTHHLGRKEHNLENPILISGAVILKLCMLLLDYTEVIGAAYGHSF